MSLPLIARRCETRVTLIEAACSRPETEEQQFYEKIHVKTLPGWAGKLILALVVFLIFAVIMLVLSWLMPVILLGVLGYFIYKLVMRLV